MYYYKTKFRGVFPSMLPDLPWQAIGVCTKGKRLAHLGPFRTEVEAALAYDEHQRSAGHPERLNFPRPAELLSRRTPLARPGTAEEPLEDPPQTGGSCELLGLTEASRAEIQARIAAVRRTKSEPRPRPVYPMRMRKNAHVSRT